MNRKWRFAFLFAVCGSVPARAPNPPNCGAVVERHHFGQRSRRRDDFRVCPMGLVVFVDDDLLEFFGYPVSEYPGFLAPAQSQRNAAASAKRQRVISPKHWWPTIP